MKGGFISYCSNYLLTLNERRLYHEENAVILYLTF